MQVHCTGLLIVFIAPRCTMQSTLSPNSSCTLQILGPLWIPTERKLQGLNEVTGNGFECISELWASSDSSLLQVSLVEGMYHTTSRAFLVTVANIIGTRHLISEKSFTRSQPWLIIIVSLCMRWPGLLQVVIGMSLWLIACTKDKPSYFTESFFWRQLSRC